MDGPNADSLIKSCKIVFADYGLKKKCLILVQVLFQRCCSNSTGI